MALYALTNSAGVVLRVADGAFIPVDPRNADYRAFQAWLALGNQADPYVPPAPNPAGIIADSAQSLGLAQAKQSLAHGDLAGALALLIQHVERS